MINLLTKHRDLSQLDFENPQNDPIRVEINSKGIRSSASLFDFAEKLNTLQRATIPNLQRIITGPFNDLTVSDLTVRTKEASINQVTSRATTDKVSPSVRLVFDCYKSYNDFLDGRIEKLKDQFVHLHSINKSHFDTKEFNYGLDQIKVLTLMMKNYYDINSMERDIFIEIEKDLNKIYFSNEDDIIARNSEILSKVSETFDYLAEGNKILSSSRIN